MKSAAPLSMYKSKIETATEMGKLNSSSIVYVLRAGVSIGDVGHVRFGSGALLALDFRILVISNTN